VVRKCVFMLDVGMGKYVFVTDVGMGCVYS
jgi:hypothetical protein